MSTANTWHRMPNLHLRWIISFQYQNPIRYHCLQGLKCFSCFSSSGSIRNHEYEYIQCPYTKWDGWEVDIGNGIWVEDETLTSTCYSEDESVPTSTTSPTTSTMKPTTTEDDSHTVTYNPDPYCLPYDGSVVPDCRKYVDPISKAPYFKEHAISRL